MKMKTSFLLTGVLLGTALAAKAAPTFNQDIAPILYHNCSSCHRPGEAAPFSLLSYGDATRKARMIAKLTASHAMPPWKAEVASYAYRDERRLSEAQIALIQDWVKAGTPEGTGPAPKAPVFASGWQIGEPDLVVTMPAGYHVPADGPDIYRNIAVSLGLTEDKWVTAIDMRPSARAVVHHVLYYADPSGKAHQKPSQGEEPGFSGMRTGASLPLGGWAVGAQPHFLPGGYALFVPKGSDLVVQYHFHPTGKPEVEKSEIGFYFAKQAPDRMIGRVQMPPHYSLFSGLDIPAGNKDFVIRDSYTLPIALDGLGVGAHAHYLAKEMKMTATLPGGEVKTLLYIKDWDFAWQDRYFFQDLVMLPEGTRLDTEIHWDNSATNPHNPSIPPVRVWWGEESKDEMGSVTLIAVPHNQGELPILNKDEDVRAKKMAHEKMVQDPVLAKRVMRMMAE